MFQKGEIVPQLQVEFTLGHPIAVHKVENKNISINDKGAETISGTVDLTSLKSIG